MTPYEAIDRISGQLAKLISISGSAKPGRAKSPVANRRSHEPQYHLLHSLTWDEDGELDMR